MIFWWETFNNGQTPGKYIMKLRVINKNGSRPTMGSFFMRWLLSTIDVGCGGHVVCSSILLTKNSQRLGDLAAGTMVIKLTDIRKIHISLDEFYYAKKDYHPVYEEAKNLSQAQVAVIEKARVFLQWQPWKPNGALADKVAKFLKVQPKENSKEKFLATILHDYNYYLMESSKLPSSIISAKVRNLEPGWSTSTLLLLTIHQDPHRMLEANMAQHTAFPPPPASHPISPYWQILLLSVCIYRKIADPKEVRFWKKWVPWLGSISTVLQRYLNDDTSGTDMRPLDRNAEVMIAGAPTAWTYQDITFAIGKELAVDSLNIISHIEIVHREKWSSYLT